MMWSRGASLLKSTRLMSEILMFDPVKRLFFRVVEEFYQDWLAGLSMDQLLHSGIRKNFSPFFTQFELTSAFRNGILLGLMPF
jgi:hypothetical protein